MDIEEGVSLEQTHLRHLDHTYHSIGVYGKYQVLALSWARVLMDYVLILLICTLGAQVQAQLKSVEKAELDAPHKEFARVLYTDECEAAINEQIK